VSENDAKSSNMAEGHQDGDRSHRPSTSKMVVNAAQLEELIGKSTGRNSKLGHCIPQ